MRLLKGGTRECVDIRKESKMEDKEALLQVIEGVTNLLTGMQFDPEIPPHAKESMRAKVAELELVIERTRAELWGY